MRFWFLDLVGNVEQVYQAVESGVEQIHPVMVSLVKLYGVYALLI